MAAEAHKKLPWYQMLEVEEWDVETGKRTTTVERADVLLARAQLNREVEAPVSHVGPSWDEAIQIARRRRERRSKGVSDSWSRGVLNALQQLPCYPDVYPLEVKPSHIREMVRRMEERGYKNSTIAQRSSLISGLIDAVIKSGIGCENDDAVFTNPFTLVDTAGVSEESFFKPDPIHYRQCWLIRETLPVDVKNLLELLIFTGVRIGEAINAPIVRDKNTGQRWLDIKQLPNGWRPKNRASVRSVPIPDWIDVSSLPPNTSKFRRHFDSKVRNKVELLKPLTAHSWRHGYKTSSRIARAEELTTERLLGHAISKMAMVYGEYPRELLLSEARKTWTVIDELCNSDSYEMPDALIPLQKAL